MANFNIYRRTTTSNRVVHIVGVGAIGEPLAHLLLTHKKDLSLDEVTFHKNSASSIDAGAKLVCDENKRKDFQALGFNTQLMHTLWFHFCLSKPLTLDQIKQRVLENPELSVTEKLSAPAVFQVGRERGFRGRILNQAVVPLSTLQVSEDGMDAVGFCFTPQDGNSLVSSVAATAWFLHGADYLKYLRPLKLHYLPEV